MKQRHYQVAIVGAGITGTALFYALARYSSVSSIVLIEKYEGLATLNSKATANSQTIHSGDIETNYDFEKAARVRRVAAMLPKYALMHGYNGKYVFEGQKMALGVGDAEVEFIKSRYDEFKQLYPYLEFFDKAKLAQIEPNVVYDANGKERAENIAAMGVTSGVYTTIDYGAIAATFVENAKNTGKKCDVFLNSEIDEMSKNGDEFSLKAKNGLEISADFVVVDAGAHSLFLAHKMGYGLNLGCLPMAGSFYMTRQKLLNGKVYMVQNPKLPFAALHGDPDLLGFTRFGPTALVLPKLERYHGTFKSFLQFCKTLNLGSDTANIFWDLLKDRDIRNYALRNYLFEIPYVNKKIFVADARKIVPSLKESDIYYASGFGGVRPQVLNKTDKTLMLGESTINTGEGVIFNMTPSPGATSCLGNAERDIASICAYLNESFDTDKFSAELCD